MPRDASGNYSLPVGNPVVTGTTISSVWANTTMPDLATAVQNSLDRNGLGGMLAPLKHSQGAVGAPSITFNGEPQTGWYRAGVGDVRYAVSGVDAFRVFNNQAQVWDIADGAWIGLLDAKGAGATLETQTLDGTQTEVTFTRAIGGAALYVDGTSGDRGRLLLDTDYTFDAPSNTVTLSVVYPVNTKLTAVIDGDADAAAAAVAAQASAAAALLSEQAAADAEAAAEAALADFETRYLGAFATAPTTDNEGNPLITGALYFNATDDTMFVWNGDNWQAASIGILGTAAYANLTTSPTDTTAGRVTRVGDGGYQKGINLTDYNAVVVPEGENRMFWTAFPSNSPGFGGAYQYGLQFGQAVQGATNAYDTQVVWDAVEDAGWRQKSNGTWQSWRMFYDTGNVAASAQNLLANGSYGLGGYIQSAGTPTGNDANNALLTGWYDCFNTTANTPIGDFGVLRVESRNDARIYQKFHRIGGNSSPETWERVSFGAPPVTWGGWRKIYTEANVAASAQNLLANGSYGLGSDNLPALVNLNDPTTRTGLYEFNASAGGTGTRPAGSNFGIVSVEGDPANINFNGWVKQKYRTVEVPNDIWTRSYNGAGGSPQWTAWVKTYSSGNTASQAEAEAGTVNDKPMTPLRTKQAIAAQAAGGKSAHLKFQFQAQFEDATGPTDVLNEGLSASVVSVAANIPNVGEYGIFFSGAAGPFSKVNVHFQVRDYTGFTWVVSDIVWDSGLQQLLFKTHPVGPSASGNADWGDNIDIDVSITLFN